MKIALKSESFSLCSTYIFFVVNIRNVFIFKKQNDSYVNDGNILKLNETAAEILKISKEFSFDWYRSTSFQTSMIVSFTKV